MFSISTTIILILSCIGTSVGSGQYRGGHGSHQHMKNSHQHHVPQRQESAPVQSVLQDKKLIHDHEHLKEDLKDVYTEEEIFKMTTDEIEFHYFKLHDYDDNNLLDGIEIMAAISHIVPHDPDLDLGRQPEGNVLTAEQQLRLKAAQQSKADQIEHFTKMIDKMVEDSDTDKDGFINYQEYRGMIDKMIQDSDNDKDGFVNYQEYKRVRRPDGV